MWIVTVQNKLTGELLSRAEFVDGEEARENYKDESGFWVGECDDNKKVKIFEEEAV